ncbi:hypothetical protein [Parafrankia elaeagni]|uniref:hypothetical protein n=1 Tax=Parafrankia elaeagni TaxID=222534 RepID=UPI000372F7E2|nr:hypothetical protein [Parafrankia elaeagni]
MPNTAEPTRRPSTVDLSAVASSAAGAERESAAAAEAAARDKAYREQGWIVRTAAAWQPADLATKIDDPFGPWRDGES